MGVEIPWTRLIRFVSDEDGQTHFGDAILPSPDYELGKPDSPGELKARRVLGDPLSPACTLDDRAVKVRKLLGPLTRDQVPALRCIGGNYKSHSKNSIKRYPTVQF